MRFRNQYFIARISLGCLIAFLVGCDPMNNPVSVDIESPDAPSFGDPVALYPSIVLNNYEVT
jgi:hypothetical protein